MPFIPAEDTAQVRIIQSLHNQTINNVMYFTRNGGWSAAELVALGNLVMAWWNDHLAPDLSDQIVLEGVAARDMSVEDGAGIELAAPLLSTGDLASAALPGNVALTVKFITGLTGRNRRGRNFVAGLAEIQQNGNELLLASRDNIVAAFGELRDDAIAAGYTPVVASFYDGTTLVEKPDGTIVKVPTPRPGGALTTPIEQYRADIMLDSQRRRLAGRGV